jgi:peptide deformylase
MNRMIVNWPHPALRKPAEDVEDFSNDALQELVVDLIDTCNVKMGIGLAANQIGVDRNVFVLRPKTVGADNFDPSEYNADFIVCVNPRLDTEGRAMTSWQEGCLSLPGLEMNVKRFSSGTLHYHTLNGEERTIELSWPLVGAVQHEIDHLQGKTIAHAHRKASATSLTLSMWQKKRQKQKRKERGNVK